MPYTPRNLSPYRSVKQPGFSDAFKTTMGQALANALGNTLGSGASYLTQRGLETATNDPSLRQREANADLTATQAMAQKAEFEDYSTLRERNLTAKGSQLELDAALVKFNMDMLNKTGSTKIAAAATKALSEKLQSEYEAAQLGATDQQMGAPAGTVADRLLSQKGMNEQITTGLAQEQARTQTDYYREMAKNQPSERSLAWEKQGFEEQKWLDQKNALARSAAAAAANRGKTEAEKQRLAFEKQVSANMADYEKSLADKGESAWTKDKDGNDVQVSKLTNAQKAALQTKLARMADLEKQARAYGYNDIAESLRRQLNPTAKPEPIGDSYTWKLRDDVTSTNLGMEPEKPLTVQDQLAAYELEWRKEIDPIKKDRLQKEADKFAKEALSQDAYADYLRSRNGGGGGGGVMNFIKRLGEAAAKGKPKGNDKAEPPLKTGGGKGQDAANSEFGVSE